jgi:hypothetical protein
VLWTRTRERSRVRRPPISGPSYCLRAARHGAGRYSDVVDPGAGADGYQIQTTRSLRNFLRRPRVAGLLVVHPDVAHAAYRERTGRRRQRDLGFVLPPEQAQQRGNGDDADGDQDSGGLQQPRPHDSVCLLSTRL